MLPRMTAGTLAVIAFALAIFRGLWVDNPLTTVLLRAWYAMILFLILGAAIGHMTQIMLNEYFKRRTEKLLKDIVDEERSQAGEPSVEGRQSP